MKPGKILLFFIGVFAILSLIIAVLPEDGIRITENFRITFPTFKDIFNPEKIEYADISDIINLEADSVSIKDTDSVNVKDSFVLDAANLRKKLSRLQYPEGNKTVIYPFFKVLDKLASKRELIRIIHYGDSQIEGDRMTGFIRNKLQILFGGTGIGLMPAIEISPRFTLATSTSNNWKRYPGFGARDTNVRHNRYGALFSFCRFAPISNDSTLNDSIDYSATISFKKSGIGYYRNNQYTQIKMFYGYNKQDVLVQLFLLDKLFSTDTLKASNTLEEIVWDLKEAPEEVTISFKGKDSPDIYGFAIDGYQGIAVDNVPMRGCSGEVFTRVDKGQMKQLFNSLNVKLLILQFGGNVMPYVNSKKKCVNYGKWFGAQIFALKRIKPDLNIIVIGVSDMSVKNKGEFITYPLLEDVRDALKDASFRAGCPYWDMYEAMGGKNSMPSWVEAKPALAATDYAHFSPKGATILAEIFYNSFIADYNEYKTLTKKTSKSK